MRAVPHAMIGAATTIPVALLNGKLAIPILIAGALGGILPDVDHPYSLAGRFVPWPAKVIRDSTGRAVRTGRWLPFHTIWHRGEFHSIGMALAFSYIAFAILNFLNPFLGTGAYAWGAAGIIFIGYISHLVVDMANPSPQMLLFPLSLFLPARYKMIRPTPFPAISSHTLRFMVLEFASGVAACTLIGILIILPMLHK